MRLTSHDSDTTGAHLTFRSLARRSRCLPWACWWLTWLLYCGTACAASAITPFDAGVLAYRSGDFEAALRHFQDARAEGSASGQLLFNLGLTLYRLEQYDVAREVLLELREHSGMSGAADYHLGLIAAQRGDRDEAVLRLSAAAAGDSPELRRLAQTALGRLQDQRPARRFAGYARGGLGFDSNRNQVSESLRIEGPQPESAYADVYGSVIQRLAGRGRTDLRANLFVRDYEVDDALEISEQTEA